MTPLTAAGLTIGLVLGVVCLVILEVMYLTWQRKRRRDGDSQGGEGEKGPMLQNSSRSFGGPSDLFLPPFDKILEMPSDSPWMSPELPGDCHWGQARIVKLHGGGGMGGGGLRIVNNGLDPPQRAATLNSSLVELDVGREG